MAAKRIKQVVDASTVSHLWAHQTQDHARTPGNGSYYFNGPDIYSYGSHFKIATQIDIPASARERIATAFEGTDNNPFTANVLVLFTTRTYSVTTAGHIQLTRRAVSHLPVLDMPVFVEELEAPTNEWDLLAWHRKHDQNLNHFIHEAKESREKAEKARADWRIHSYAVEVRRYMQQAKQYMMVYGIYNDPTYSPRIVETINPLAEYDRVYVAKDPVTEEKREKARAARERAKEREAEKLKNQWLNGEDEQDEKWYGWKNRTNKLETITKAFGVLLRVSNGEVQTTKGATVPVKDARKLLRYVRLVKETNTDMPEIIAKGLLHVGNYRVSRITKDGDLIVGCHSILNSEIERFAKEQEWTDAVTVESLSE